MAVRTDDAGHNIADAHAVAHLRNRSFVVLAEHLQRAVLKFRPLRLHRCNAGRGVRRLAHQMLLARGIAIGAPRRHRAHARALNAAVGIDSGGAAKLASSFLMRIRASHGSPLLIFCCLTSAQRT
jgi:hypothetical protein